MPDLAGNSEPSRARPGRHVCFSHPALLRFAGCMLALTSFAACRDAAATNPPAGSSDVTLALVYGHVRNANGAPLANASVRATVHANNADCRSGANGLSGGAPSTTDSLGRYRAQVTSPLEPTTLCVSVQVRPFPSAGLTIVGGDKSVRMTDTTGGRALDSVSVDVRIP